jgi:hypothetical protein
VGRLQPSGTRGDAFVLCEQTSWPCCTYRRKRQALLASTAHLLEIDLLRTGERPSLAEPLPEALYFIILSRAERRPIAEVWPLQQGHTNQLAY